MMLYVSILFFFMATALFFISVKASNISFLAFHHFFISLFWGVCVFFVLGIPIDIVFYDAKYSDYYYLVLFYSSFLFLGVVFAIFSLGWGFKWRGDREFRWEVGDKDKRVFIFLLIFGFFSLLILYWRMPGLPLFAERVHVARVEYLRGLGYNYKIALYSIYVSAFSLSYYMIDRNRQFQSFFLVIAMFVALAPTANRIDSLFVVLVWAVAYLYVKNKEGGVRIRKFLAFSLIPVILLMVAAVMQFIRHKGFDVFMNSSMHEVYEFSLGGFYHRFWVQLENLYYIISREASVSPFATFYNDFLMAIPGTGVDKTSGVLLKEAAGLHFRGGGITPTFAGEGIAQFGYVGASVYVFLLGYFLSVVSFLVNFYAIKIPVLYPFVVVGGVFLHGLATSTIVAVFIHTVAPLILIYFFVFCLRKIIPASISTS